MDHPQHGGRVLLEREHVDEHEARYRVTLYAPAVELTSIARVRIADGEVTLDPFPGDAPPFLVDGARAFLRTAWTTMRSEGTFPRRVLRWRPAK